MENVVSTSLALSIVHDMWQDSDKYLQVSEWVNKGMDGRINFTDQLFVAKAWSKGRQRKTTSIEQLLCTRHSKNMISFVSLNS